MPRVVSVVALVLMLLTGLVLGQMTSLGRNPAPLAATSDTASAETARAFYSAINLFLKTGDAGSVAHVLAPTFVGHSAHSSREESADDLIHYWQSLRSTFSGLKLEVSDLSAQAGIVAVDVTITGETSGSFAGVALDAGAGVSGYEVLRVEGEQIVERWGSREMPPLYQFGISVDIPIPANAIPEPRIERLTFEPNGSLEVIDHDGFVLIAESGTITYQGVRRRIDRSDPGMVSESASTDSALGKIDATVELKTGQAFDAPAGVRYRIVNHGPGSANALMLSIRQGQLGMGNVVAQEVTESIGVNRTLLAGGGSATAQYENGSRAVAVGQVVLSPGATIPRHVVEDAELLVVIEGEIDVTVHHGTLIWNQPGKSFVTVAHKQTISAGQGARANPGAVLEYHAGGDEPATLWIVTIQGGDAEDPSG